MLIFDLQKKTCERFEPNSVVYQHSPQRYNDIMSNKAKLLKKNLTKNFKGMKYFEPFRCTHKTYFNTIMKTVHPIKTTMGAFVLVFLRLI